MEETTNYCNNIDQEMLQNIFENKKRRIRMCLQQNGGHFLMLIVNRRHEKLLMG